MFKKSLFVLQILSLLMFPLLFSKNASAEKINVALGGGPLTTMDPTAWAGGTLATYYNVHEPLIGFDAKNKITGILADSWQLSPDGKILTVKLKKNVKFSSGDKFTAKDVIFTMERSRKANFAVIDQLNPKVFDRAEIVDDYTIKFLFPKANVQLLPQTLSFMMMVSKDEFDRLGEKEFVKNPAGTGPYKCTANQPGQFVDLVYNENYRGKKPQITEAHYVFAPDNATRIKMLQAGEVDMINQTDWKSVASLVNSGYKRFDKVQPHDVAIQFQLFNKKTPWANAKVRQAMNYVIDKQLLIDKLFGGVPQKGVWQLPWELGYDKSLDESYPYNPAKAKQLMKEAGFEKGFELPLYYLADMSWARDVVDYLATTFKQLGINSKLKPISGFANYMDTTRNLGMKKDSEAALVFDFGWPGNPEPVINLTNGFWSGKPNSLYSRPDLDAIIEKALVTVDNKQRGKLVTQAYKIIKDDLPFIPILLEVDVHMMKSNYTYTPTLSDMNNNPCNIFDLKVK